MGRRQLGEVHRPAASGGEPTPGLSANGTATGAAAAQGVRVTFAAVAARAATPRAAPAAVPSFLVASVASQAAGAHAAPDAERPWQTVVRGRARRGAGPNLAALQRTAEPGRLSGLPAMTPPTQTQAPPPAPLHGPADFPALAEAAAMRNGAPRTRAKNAPARTAAVPKAPKLPMDKTFATDQQPSPAVKECSVCCDAPANAVMRPCGHRGLMCVACGETWLKRSAATPGGSTCPFCRAVLRKVERAF